jgi:hypothetical protein
VQSLPSYLPSSRPIKHYTQVTSKIPFGVDDACDSFQFSNPKFHVGFLMVPETSLSMILRVCLCVIFFKLTRVWLSCIHSVPLIWFPYLCQIKTCLCGSKIIVIVSLMHLI